MFIDPCTLIDQTIDHLQTLSEFLADETGERIHRRAAITPEAYICRDAQATIAALIPKLRAARVMQEPQAAHRVCINCDD